MFTIRNEVYESFESAPRSTQRDRILSGLRRKGVAADHDVATGDLVVTEAQSKETRLSFAADMSPSRLTMPSGRFYRISGDADGRSTRFEDCRGAVFLVKSDREGKPVQIGQPGVSEYQFRYDPLSRLTEIEYPDSSCTRLIYGESGSLASVVDRTGASAFYEYDPGGRLTAIIDALGRRTDFKFGERGGLTAVQFPDNSAYTFEDGVGGLRKVRLRDESRVDQYFADGVLRRVCSEDGDDIRFESDMDGNVRRAFDVGTQRCVECTFDHEGKRLRETSEKEGLSYRYDTAGRLVAIEGTSGYLVEYDYDADGNVQSVRTAGGPLYRSHHDWRRGVTEISYGDAARETREHGLHGSVVRAKVQDAAGWLLSEAEYEYDSCHRLVHIIDACGADQAQRVSRRLMYDAEGRLRVERNADSGQTVVEYDYDAKGNLVYEGGVRTIFGSMDEPLERGEDVVSYDANGAVAEIRGPSGMVRSTFSARGMLREVEVPGRIVRFEYDPLGRRTAKIEGGNRWSYVWAGYQLIREELEVHGVLATTREYFYSPDAANPVAFRENGRTYWLLSDIRGAIVRAVSESGEVVWAGVYDSFGKIRIEEDSIRQPWRLAGQYEDDETGLYYNLTRYYCPWIRSYLSLDPLWMQQGATNYSYAVNDPWNKIDPLGTLAFLPILGAALLCGAISAGVAWYFHGSTTDIVAAFVGGAVAGALLAVGGGVIAAVGLKGAMFYVAYAGAGFLSGIAGSFTSEVLDSHAGICWPCVAASGIISAVLAPVSVAFSRWLGSTRFGQWLSGKLRFGAPPEEAPVAKPTLQEEAPLNKTTTGGKTVPEDPLNGPSSRHQLNKVGQGTLAKDLNTVVEPSVDVSADVKAINAGDAVEGLTKNGIKTYTINGRTYGVHDGTLYPMSGDGFHVLDRPAFKALGVYNKFGQTPEAEAILEKMGISESARAQALEAWQAGHGSN